VAAEPFIEDTPPEEPPSRARLWSAVALLAFGVALLIAATAYVWPMLGEGFFVHAPARATVEGRGVRIVREEHGERKETVYLVAWTDDRGRAQKGELQTVGRTFAPGAELPVRYALKPDGEAAEVWPADPDLIWIGPLVFFLSAGVTIVLLFAQTLAAALRAPRPPAPTPGSDPSP
jgi:hypothetical protein